MSITQVAHDTVATSGGGGGGASTIADGADVTEGALADVAVTGDNSGTLSAKLRGLGKVLTDVWDSVNHQLKVSIQNATLAVTQSGTWTVTANLGTLNGASTSAKQDTGNTSLASLDTKVPALGQALAAASVPVVLTAAQITTLTPLSSVTAANTAGNVAHDGVDSGNPVKVGQKAVSFGSNPTDVSSGDRTDWYSSIAGIPFVLQGHPNIITRRDNYSSAQTDTKLITVSGGTKIVVVSCTIACDAAGTTKPLVRAGFAASTTPTGAGTYISHPGLAAGSGIAERTLVAGADGDDFIFTCAVPTTGSIDVITKYFTITS